MAGRMGGGAPEPKRCRTHATSPPGRGLGFRRERVVAGRFDELARMLVFCLFPAVPFCETGFFGPEKSEKLSYARIT